MYTLRRHLWFGDKLEDQARNLASVKKKNTLQIKLQSDVLTLVPNGLRKEIVTCKCPQRWKIVVCCNIFHHATLFSLADRRYFSWCNVIQQM